MEKIVEASLKKAATTLQESYERFLKQENTNSIILNERYFHQDYCEVRNITTCVEHREVFQELRDIKSPVLYWFEIKTPEKLSENIRERYNLYRDKIRGNYNHPDYRNTSSFKKHLDPDSKALYVGKVEKNFLGRMVTHLGYSQSKKTAGMQLFHWFDPKEFGDITLNYFVFKNDMKYLISVLEKESAKQLKPILGRY